LLLVYENDLRSGLHTLVYCIPPNPLSICPPYWGPWT